ncbi:TPA: low temperature requirement protein A [Staphylococcus aureus]|nr:low temperature requirement protein A [Staphylococcus aureus]
MVNTLMPKHLAEKRAGFHELFFDLIFVYAIQKIAHVILTTQNGSISAELFFKYIVMSLFLWLMWSHQTFFTNRFGQVTFKDVSFMMFNMFIMVFLSNSLYPDFEKTFFPFFLCVAIMYLSIGLQYLLHIRTGLDYGDKRTCQAFATVAFVISFLSFLSLVLPQSIHYIPGFLGVFIAATGLIPFQKYLILSPVNMMHLVERFSLLTIIIFGEVLVGLASSSFSIDHFSYIYIFQFMILISLFGVYWIITENYINHKLSSIGFRLSYTHLLINIALGVINAAIVFSNSNKLNDLFEINMMYISVLVFYIGLWLITPYFHNELTNAKYISYSLGILVMSYIVSLLFKGHDHVMIISVSVATFCIMLIYFKNQRLRNKHK